MTVTELRYLIVLAQTKHFGKAAARCHVSQPTLSVAVAKLEKALGVAIFERHHHHLEITKVGEEIILQAQKSLEEINKIKHIAMEGKSQLTESLRIGAIYTVAPYLFPTLIPKLKKIAPKMPLIIHEDFTAQLRTKLQQGELDVVFISLPFNETGIVCKKLYTEPFVVLLQKNHPLAAKTTIQCEALKNENVLLLGEGHCFRNQVIQVCPSCCDASRGQETIEGASLETLRHMVASGMGITILPSTATQIKHYQHLLTIRPFQHKNIERTIALAWRASFPRTKAIDAILQAVKEAGF
ncbi:MAG: LysR family transcriptional regulator [Gammaproteobacteria bacterium RIFCSPHIGHO2_12_FULL_37_14]|nr:MAG: LysR family transcriptional regulator [Gammaproteobacteria bacterium RIFCSPHIGHO2_12_FULL_37_14]